MFLELIGCFIFPSLINDSQQTGYKIHMIDKGFYIMASKKVDDLTADFRLVLAFIKILGRQLAKALNDEYSKRNLIPYNN